jgi:hypothetical protein
VIQQMLRLAAVVLLLVLLPAGCGGTSDSSDATAVSDDPSSAEPVGFAEESIIGVKIYKTERELPELFEEWQSLGVNTVFASEELTSSGGFRALAKRNDIDLFIIFPMFFAPEELAENPDLWAVTADGERAKEDWVEFACPSRSDFRNRRVKEARAIVKRLRPDGLSIDFIRYFVFWEMVGPDRDPATLPDTCYCVHCIQAFATFLGVPPLTIPPQPQRAAAWIEANAAEQWVRFRIETITSMVRELVDEVREIDPDILINLHIVPWRRDDFDGGLARVAGQDPSALSEIADYLSPMAYSFMLERPPEWVASVVEDLDRVADCPVLPSIQVAPAYREGEVFSGAEFEAALLAALEPPSAGVVFWSWDHIEADPGRAEIIRRVVRGGSPVASSQ